MIETFLFIFFFILTTIGIYLIWNKSGNHDIDFIIKILGWIILIPSILGLLQLLKIL